MHNKLNILPLSLYEFEIPEDIFEQLSKDCTDINWGTVENRDGDPQQGKTYAEESWHNKQEYKYIVDFCNKCLEEVREDLGFDAFESLRCSSMWPNRSVQGQGHHKHMHEWSFLSGIIYVKNTSGRTSFSRPSEYMNIISTNFPLKSNYEVGDQHDIVHRKTPKPGTLIIFPSNLYHSADEVANFEERITIGFNSFPAGLIGTRKKLASLEIKIK